MLYILFIALEDAGGTVLFENASLLGFCETLRRSHSRGLKGDFIPFSTRTVFDAIFLINFCRRMYKSLKKIELKSLINIKDG